MSIKLKREMFHTLETRLSLKGKTSFPRPAPLNQFLPKQQVLFGPIVNGLMVLYFIDYLRQKKLNIYAKSG